MAKIFVSFTSSDRKWAKLIEAQLMLANHEPLLHDNLVRPGDDFYRWMINAFEQVEYCVCIVSEEYLAATWSMDEFAGAVRLSVESRKGFCLPVIVDAAKMPRLARGISYCKVSGMSDEEAAMAFQAYINRLPVAREGLITNSNRRAPTHFMGRDEVIAEIDEAFKKGPTIALSGMRGAGKSTVATAYVERRRHDYRVIWWLRAETEALLCSDLVSLGESLGWVRREEGADAPQKTVLKRLQTEGDKILLIYDNAIDAQSLEPYLPFGSGAHALITSNAPTWRRVAKESIALQLWPNSVGAEYLLARTDKDRNRADAEALADALGGLPLALEVAAAYCERTQLSFEEFRRRLASNPNRILKKAAAEYPLSVPTAFALAVAEAAKIHPAAEHLMRHFAVLEPEPIPLFLFQEGSPFLADPLRTLLEKEEDELDEALSALRSLALVDREMKEDERDPTVQTDTIRIHRLVRAIVAAQNDQEALRGQLIGAVAAVYPPDDLFVLKNWPKARRLDAIAFGLVRDIKCIPRGSELRASDLMDKLGAYRNASTADYDQAQTLFEASLKIREATPGAELSVAQSLNNLALLSLARGQPITAKSLCERALKIRIDKLGPNHTDVATSKINLARILREQNNLVSARANCEQALTSYEAGLGSEHPHVATALSCLGRVFVAEGNASAAIPHFERALAIYKKALGDQHPAVAVALENLAEVLPDRNQAPNLLRKALKINQDVFSSLHPNVAWNLSLLGSALEHVAPDEARGHFEEALRINMEVLGPDHANTRSVRELLSALLRRRN